MDNPINEAARLIVSAQSVITDLTVQQAEIQNAIERQQALIDSLTPVSEWGTPLPEDTEEQEGIS